MMLKNLLAAIGVVALTLGIYYVVFKIIDVIGTITETLKEIREKVNKI